MQPLGGLHAVVLMCNKLMWYHKNDHDSHNDGARTNKKTIIPSFRGQLDESFSSIQLTKWHLIDYINYSRIFFICLHPYRVSPNLVVHTAPLSIARLLTIAFISFHCAGPDHNISYISSSVEEATYILSLMWMHYIHPFSLLEPILIHPDTLTSSTLSMHVL